MKQIPDGMPTLSRGAHPPKSGRACVMEYVSVLAGEEWTDSPSCTLPYIASVARSVNDGYDEESRQHLTVLIGRLLVANVPKHRREEVTARLKVWTREHTGLLGRQIALCPCGCTQTPFEGYTMEFLSGLLDEFDRVTGRDKAPQISDRQRVVANHTMFGVAPPPDPAATCTWSPVLDDKPVVSWSPFMPSITTSEATGWKKISSVFVGR